MASAILLLLPFIQVGVSYYASVASVATLVILFAWRLNIISGLSRAALIAVTASLMFLSIFDFVSKDIGQEFLRVLREAMIFLVMASSMRDLARRPPPIRLDLTLRVLLIVVVSEALLVLLQVWGYSRGQYFGIPTMYFASDANTIADELALYYSDLRPSGTFQEASYLGFVLTSIVVMVLPMLAREKTAILIFAIAVIAGLLSRSLAFIASLTVITVAYSFQPTSAIKPRNLAALLAALFLVGVATTDIGSVLQRIGQGSSIYGDASIFARIVAPIVVLPQYILAYPFGVVFQNMVEALYPFMSNTGVDAAEITHNGLINIFFEFGFIGIPICLLYFSSTKRVVIACYLFVCGSFNGSLFAPDKFAVIVTTVAVYEAFRISSMRRPCVAIPDRNVEMIGTPS